MDKKISVIMSIYKESKKELKDSIESILNQTYKSLEFIIVIDNPEEKWREEFVNSYSDERIKLIINEKNIGLPKSLNIALGVAQGKYVARMDADDISKENRLESQMHYLEKNELDLVGSFTECFRDEEPIKIMQYPVKSENVKKVLKYYSCVAHPTWFGTKELFTELRGYRNIFSCEDYDFLIRAASKNYKLGNIPEVLLKYRMSPKSISRSNLGKQKIINNYLGDNYANGKETTEDGVIDFISSNTFENELKKINLYYELKSSKNDSFKSKLNYLTYAIYIGTNIKQLVKFVRGKVLYKYILKKQQKESNI